MKITYVEYLLAENMIETYFNNKKAIEAKRIYSDKLRDRLLKIECDGRSASNVFSLKTDMAAIQYDRINVMGGSLPCSDMDRQIDIIFSKIENERDNLNKELLLTNIYIRKLESENDLMEQILNLLNEESKELINLKFNDGLSYDQIGDVLPISKANVSKKLKKVKRDLIKWVQYYQKKNNGNDLAQSGNEMD